MASYSAGFGPEMTPVVRRLLFLNFGVFALEFVLRFIPGSALGLFLQIFGLTPSLVLGKFFVWQLLTYSVLHDPNSVFHILFNMLSLWMFGSTLEAYWGGRNFLKFYLFSCLGGGIVPIVAHLLDFPQGTIVGASGGIYGLLVAFALIWPNRELYFFGIFPIKAKYLILIILLLIAFTSKSSGVKTHDGGESGGIAVTAHAGGALFGFLYFLYYNRLKNRFSFSLPSFSFSRWRQKRKMKRWQEDMKEREKAKDEVDRLLEKISQEGMDSLSRKEKKFLKDASSKYYSDK
ncbi:rhomboid family intramembrane serine protease [Leptospira perolatii]|uniref:Rhomboid family intramembrane serine protease n=1 Tax=Leptospira perolatii TaxID=2023191 RepID=A0A2M9ZIW1_9LEPT|nr:rhomboid family intramembrane serine protease [Leptospira perolatii]PJZ68649.1 rhomboid family intramembrane serine protease [Leptospira perolatii]PJZ71996.1 rhomboid family intramembrane serine protease [Leptospira perolatii]